MHVALVIVGDPDTLTGGFIYDRHLVQALRGRGHRVEVIALPWRRYVCRLRQNFSPRLRARLSEDGWDLVLQDGLAHPALFLLNRGIRSAHRAPLVGILHQVLSGQPRSERVNRVYRSVESRYLNGLDAFVFNSGATRRQALALVREPGPDRVVRPAGNRLGSLSSPETIANRGRRDGPIELLFVGNISPVKGLTELLAALAGLDRQAWRLTVVGGLAFDRRCVTVARGVIASHGLTRQVEFLGPLAGEALREAFARSHLLAMPFAHEGFGMAALEAMGFGLPVIGSTAGGVGEFVRHADNGFLVAPGDAEAVRRHIGALHRDRVRLATMGRSAFETFGAWPTWEETMAHACAFLEGMAR